MKLPLSLPLFFLLSLSLIIPVYADDDPDINLTNLPEQLSDAWGITEFAAGLFMSTLLCLTFLFPIAMWKKTSFAPLIVGFGVMSFCIAIGWLPYWILLVITLLVASMYASKIKRAL